MSFSFMDALGYYGPLVMIVANMWYLRGRVFHMGLFLCYIVLVILTNKQLKLWIMEPRPSGGKTEWATDYVGAERYGMPSGHSTLMLFSLVYLWEFTRDAGIAIIGMFLAAITIYQRWKYRQHSVSQLATGSAIGVLLAYMATRFTAWLFKRGYTPMPAVRVKSPVNV